MIINAISAATISILLEIGSNFIHHKAPMPEWAGMVLCVIIFNFLQLTDRIKELKDEKER